MAAIRALLRLASALAVALGLGGGAAAANAGQPDQAAQPGTPPVSVRYNGILRGSALTPPVKTNGLGTAQLALTGNELMWVVSFYGLESPPAGVVIHVLAEPGGAATPPVFDLGPNWKAPGRNNWLVGKATLSAAQIADLNAGKWYLTVRTEAHPEGEISGQFKLFE